MTTPDTIQPEYTYSVLLQYPAYYTVWAESLPTYFTFVHASSPEQAARKAVAECMSDTCDEDGACMIAAAADLRVLLVIPGAHPDVTPRTTITITEKD
jgi:hypothetical protein